MEQSSTATGRPSDESNFIWCNCLLKLLNTLKEVLKMAVSESVTDPEMKALMVDKTEGKTDASLTMRMKIEEWGSGIRGDYKNGLATPLIGKGPEIMLMLNLKPAGERRLAPPRRPRKKGGKVVAAFTFVLTFCLMPKGLVALRKQESGMQCLSEFEGQVNPARNELESHIFQLQNSLTQQLPEHMDAVKVPE
jgi:hypothetical protein